MTKFRIVIEVERDVPATQGEANEAARVVARYLRNFTYTAKAVSAEVVEE